MYLPAPLRRDKEKVMIMMIVIDDDDDIIKEVTKKEEKTNTKEGPGWPGLSIKVETFPHSTKEKSLLVTVHLSSYQPNQ